MDLIAARAGGGRQLGQSLKALLAGLAELQAKIDPPLIRRCGGRLRAQRPTGVGRLCDQTAKNGEDCERGARERREAQ